MMGEIVTRNMSSKAIANKKRNCCIFLDLFHNYKAWCTEPQILKTYWATNTFLQYKKLIVLRESSKITER